MTSINYGPQYQMTYDVNGRLGGMSGSDLSLTASYGVAGEMLGLSYGGSYYLDHYSETRTYNAMLQLTHVTVTGTSFSTQFTSGTAMDMQYIYTAGQNNGRIVQAIDGVAGETVNYTYDALNRLATAGATNATWGQAFAYDGFGNLTGKTVTQGSAPTLSVSFDPLTNHQIGQSYDANGNPASMYLTYDIENRMIQGPGGYYAYDHAGKRVKKTVTGAEEFYFYGINGKRLATTVCTGEDDGTGCQPRMYDVYFGGKLVKSRGAVVATDRLGSVRASSTGDRMTYYPYGEERTSTADGREKFGTYMRDSVTQDYADQRYYAVGMGRFNSPDPYKASGGARDPGSWNRYTYVGGDPINFVDPNGNYRRCIGPVGDQICWDEPDPPESNHRSDLPEPELDPTEPPPQGPPPIRAKDIKAYATASLALDNQDCAEAIGAANGEVAKMFLDGITFVYDGSFPRPQEIRMPDGGTAWNVPVQR
jgi:RHS repeat-associated protein